MQQQLSAPWAHRPAHAPARPDRRADTARSTSPRHGGAAERHTFVMPVVREIPRADGDGAHVTEW
jgi:hypothetical protein